MNDERSKQWREFSACFYSAMAVIDRRLFGIAGGDITGGQRTADRNDSPRASGDSCSPVAVPSIADVARRRA